MGADNAHEAATQARHAPAQYGQAGGAAAAAAAAAAALNRGQNQRVDMTLCQKQLTKEYRICEPVHILVCVQHAGNAKPGHPTAACILHVLN